MQLFFVINTIEHNASNLWKNSSFELNFPQSKEEAYSLIKRFNYGFIKIKGSSSKSIPHYYGEGILRDILKGYMYVNDLFVRKYPNPHLDPDVIKKICRFIKKSKEK